MGLPKLVLVAAGSAALALGGCSGTEPGPRPPEAPAPAPLPETTGSPPPATTGSGCGTIRAANGLTLQVEGLSGDPAGCAEARRLMDELQARIAAIGAGGHDGQLTVAVQDWLCVSGSEGTAGASCSRQDKTVSARVVPGR